MQDRRDPPPSDELEDSSRPFTERFVAPFVREPMLWPVAAVIVAHAVAFLAPVLLLALRDRRIPALGALAGIAFLSGSAVRAELARLSRPGVACALIGTIWLLAAAAAVVAHRTGIF